ncbi:DUF3829 domain-containing protein [Pseudomonas sp. Fl4BN1]|uniref:DUF3829 domain-containing protein n=1 Tax=Pseudomonas sp. Fl4BN1 TaxID=2697651 RepID=UPI001376C4F3|nr:DUF3829 domain-containing protein [Pseudomonas sp. Fl4BN1]NBF07923.1 DUF3829 domain-containing protein [Pseudomonas sp. Fl4BN1]
MNANWLLPIGLGLGMTLTVLAITHGPLDRLDLWLDQQDSPATAQANALSPIINCLNQMDVPLRLAHQAYLAAGSPRATAAGAYDISPHGGQDIDSVYRFACPGSITDKLKILTPDSPLLSATEQYLQVLGRFVTLTKGAYMQRKGYGHPLSDAQLDQFLSQLEPQRRDYLKASTSVRQLLEILDVEPRSEQLMRLEQRLDRNVHWALLDYMIQARSTVELLAEGVRQKTLTPEQLAETTRQLRQAQDTRQQFLHIEQPDKDTQKALYLWQLIAEPSDQYLHALDRLHRDWLDHAAPQRLSDDYHAITQGYDQMLYRYNKLARKQY